MSRRQYVILLKLNSSFHPVTQRQIAIVHTMLLQWPLKITFQMVEQLFSLRRLNWGCSLAIE